MLKKSLIFCTIAATYFVQAQDISTIRNTVDVYSTGTILGSAKYNAMVGSTGALGGDGFALMNNPAGLGVAISGSLNGTVVVDNHINKSIINNSPVDYSKSTVDANFSGISTFQLLTETPWKFVNLGINFSSQNLDNYIETAGNKNIKFAKNLIDENNNPVLGTVSYDGHAYNRSGNLAKMSFGVGANYDNRIYLGLGLNFHGSQLDQYDSASFGLDLDNNVSTTYDKQYTPFSETGSGFSANVGAIAKITNQIRLGLAVETPTFWNIDRVYTDYFTDTSGYISADNFSESRTLTTPLKTTISAALIPNKNFAVNVDYTIGITKTKFREDGAAEIELNEFFQDNSKNMSEIKVGAEYRIKALRLRGGYSYASNPFDTISFSAFDNAGTAGTGTSNNLILGNKSTVGAGIGYDWKSYSLDFAYQNVNSKFVNPFLAGNESFGSGYYSENFDVNSSAYAVSDVENKRNIFSLTLGAKF